MINIPNLTLIRDDLKSLSCTSTGKKYDLNNKSKKKAILLTGSTGFLGKYILSDLLTCTTANIYCLVRTKNNENIENKFYYTLNEAGLQLDNKRIILINGNLKEKNLGLKNNTLEELEECVDSIYHCGAFVHHLHTYEILRPDVIATKFLIDLSLKGKQKELHYISTMNISNPDQDIWKPANRLEDIKFYDMGYIQVKWACEKIIHSYIDRGYPFYIYRPGNITGHSDTGYSFPWNNHALLLLKGFLQHGKIPKWSDLVEMVPVNFVSKAIVQLSLNINSNNNETRTYNLHNSSTISWTEYIQRVAAILQREIEFVDENYWRCNILPYVDRNNPLMIFKEFYMIETNKFNYQPPRDLITEKLLQNLDISFSSISYEHLIKTYTEFLLTNGFLQT